jgi:hypothetical protein
MEKLQVGDLVYVNTVSRRGVGVILKINNDAWDTVTIDIEYSDQQNFMSRKTWFFREEFRKITKEEAMLLILEG